MFSPIARCAAAALALVMSLPVAVRAQPAYPARPVTLIVPFGPGGTSDIMARALADPLAKALGATLVVDNKTGAGGAIGMTALAQAPADGYTIGLSVIGPQILQPALRNTGYGPDSFDYLCGIYDLPLMMMVRPDARFASLTELLAAARARPGQLAYGSSGTGTALHLSMHMLLGQAGADALHVPYKSSGEMVTGLLGGQIAVFNETPALSTRYGLRGLAVFASQRLAAYPQVPTSAEAGFPLQASVWGGLIAPRGLPVPVRRKLEAACASATHSGDYRQKAEQLNAPLVWRDGQAFAAFAKAEQARYSEPIRTLGLADKQ